MANYLGNKQEGVVNILFQYQKILTTLARNAKDTMIRVLTSVWIACQDRVNYLTDKRGSAFAQITYHYSVESIAYIALFKTPSTTKL